MILFKELIDMDYTDISKCVLNKEVDSLEIIYSKNPRLFFEEYNGDFESALHYFAAYGDVLLLDWLYEKIKFNIDLSQKKIGTPLECAATRGNIEIVKWLIDQGALIDGNSTDLLSPLMSGVMSGHFEIVKLLIENGADVNRIHLRSGMLPLDEAKGRKRVEIEKLLSEQGAKSHYVIPEWIDDKGSGILEHLSLKFDRILPIDISDSSSLSPVKLKLVPVNNRKNRMLFTYGLYDMTKPRIELFIVLYEYWNFYNQEINNQFPIIFLERIIQAIKEGLSLKEGDYLLKTDDLFSDLTWDEQIAGFFVSDVDWKSKKEVSYSFENKEKVSLLTLIPIKATKNGFSKMSIESCRNTGWQKLTLSINGRK